MAFDLRISYALQLLMMSLIGIYKEIHVEAPFKL